MNLEEIKEKRAKIIDTYTLLESDIEIFIKAYETLAHNNLGIKKKFLPKIALGVLITNTKKYALLPKELNYNGSKTESILNNYQWIPAELSNTDKERYIAKQKLGNGTAWESGLQLNGPESTPEWADLVNYLSDYAIDDPNYAEGSAPAKVIPSIILSPYTLRKSLRNHANVMCDEFEYIATAEHEYRHIIGMSLCPWPWGGTFNEGFRPTNGHIKFLDLIEKNNITIKDPELKEIIKTDLIDKQVMPRGYIGEFQAYLGDVVNYAKTFGLKSQEMNFLIENDIAAAKDLLIRTDNKRNYFGIKMAKETINQINIDQALQMLNDIYELMSKK